MWVVMPHLTSNRLSYNDKLQLTVSGSMYVYIKLFYNNGLCCFKLTLIQVSSINANVMFLEVFPNYVTKTAIWLVTLSYMLYTDELI